MFPMKQKLSATQEKGRRAENAVASLLREEGYLLLAQNYSVPGKGEIDLIAKKDGVIHFIEVKSIKLAVSSETDPKKLIEKSYNPAENVTRKKYERIYRTAQDFLRNENVSHETFQIDLYLVYVWEKEGERRFFIKTLKDIVVS